MQAHVADQLVVRGARAPRVGVILEVIDGEGRQRFRVRWTDGHESTISAPADAVVEEAAQPQARWEEVRAAREAGSRWRPTIVAGLGREAALAQQALDAPEAASA